MVIVKTTVTPLTYFSFYMERNQEEESVIARKINNVQAKVIEMS